MSSEQRTTSKSFTYVYFPIFTGCSSENLKYIDLNIEIILSFLVIVKENYKWNMSDKLRDCFPTQYFDNTYVFLKQ